MSVTRLSLEAPDVTSLCILRVYDTSSYNPDLAPTCAQLQITAPGFTYSNYIDDVQTGFSLNLSACDLKLQKNNCGQVYNDLPDGVYVIRYSISPNDIVFVEYNHLRITKALIRLNKAICSIDFGACGVGEKERSNFEKLKDIREYLYAAKAKVEYCREVNLGMDLYKYALKLLEKITCSTC